MTDVKVMQKNAKSSDVDEMSKLIKYFKREQGRQTGVEKIDSRFSFFHTHLNVE